MRPSDRKCRVCGVSSAGALFGVDACRACAAFFRRASRDHSAFTCASETDKCDLRECSDGRRMCKKCRFSKCLAAGMIMRGNSVSPERVISADDKYSLLPAIRKNFRQQHKDRLECEQQIIARSTEELRSECTPLGPIYNSTLALVNDIMQSTLPMLGAFFDSTFTSYSQLGDEDKASLFRTFFGPFCNFERAYLSEKLLPSKPKIRMITLQTFHDLSGGKIPNADLKGSVFNLFHDRAQDSFSRHLRDSMRELDLDETEFSAYSALLMWLPDVGSGSSDSVMETCREVHGMILKDLHSYYRIEKNLTEYAIRIGKCLHILSLLKENTWRDRECGMLRAFGCFDDHPVLAEIARVLE